MKDIRMIVEPLFKQEKKESIIGLIKLKFSMSGNQEPVEFEIEKIINEVAQKIGFRINQVSVLYDSDGFSRIFIQCYDNDTFMNHIKNLEKKAIIDKRPNSLLIALNKAIRLLDNYNNMHGDTINTTTEITSLDEILKLHS